jgi:hypothetical protein
VGRSIGIDNGNINGILIIPIRLEDSIDQSEEERLAVVTSHNWIRLGPQIKKSILWGHDNSDGEVAYIPERVHAVESNVGIANLTPSGYPTESR